MSYHNRVMNIQSLPRMDDPPESGVAYKFGHRDARHAAAGIANEADAEIEQLKERIAELEQKAARCDWLLERFQSMSVQMDGTACWLFQNYELKRARSVEEAIDKAMGVWK